MAKSEMPNLPGAAVMTDTLDFVKNLWGSMNVPGMTGMAGMNIPGMNIPGITAPTLSVEELEKKINELKAVESWLTLNMGMLRTTIQALEVQRGTIITLKSMGAALASAVKQPPAAGKAQPEAAPFSSPFFQPAPHAAAAAATPAPAEPAKAPAPPHADPAAHGAATQMANPAAWWNLLQDQFKQAVNTTMASDAIAGAAAMASDAAAKFTKAAKAVTPPASAAPAPAAAVNAAAPAKKAPAKRVAAKPKATPRPTKG
jgi:hypothetical protein